MKTERITFRLDTKDKALLASLAAKLQRNQSDAIRYVLRRAADTLEIAPSPHQGSEKHGGSE